jgi:hypothetical protein
MPFCKTPANHAKTRNRKVFAACQSHSRAMARYLSLLKILGGIERFLAKNRDKTLLNAVHALFCSRLFTLFSGFCILIARPCANFSKLESQAILSGYT